MLANMSKAIRADSEMRHLLVFAPPDKGRLLKLDIKGWKILISDDLDTAKRWVEKYHIKVAIYDLSETAGNLDIDLCINNLHDKKEHILWIALINHAQLDDPNVRQYIANLCYDYHTFPLDEGRLLHSIGHAHGMADIAHKTRISIRTKTELNGMVGSCKVMQHLFRLLDKISRSQAAVLLIGESGTGKELVAQAIHNKSERNKRAIVEVNCGAIAKDLIQSELFGHEKGAFTGAEQRKIGCIEAANGGTLFLDEIGDLPLSSQVNLLRFLQEGVIKRIGSSEKIVVNVRVISATHVNLEENIMAGLFREDLYYRLNVLRLEIPPLRERQDDIFLLANVYLEIFRSDAQRRILRFSASALIAMQQHDWPGNVRELINRVRRAIVMSEGAVINAESLDLKAPTTAVNESLKLDDIRSHSESSAIFQALRQANNNVTQAAKLLSISRRSLYRLMDKHTIAVN